MGSAEGDDDQNVLNYNFFVNHRFFRIAEFNIDICLTHFLKLNTEDLRVRGGIILK